VLVPGGLRKGSPQTPSETSIAPLRSDTLSEALVPRLALVSALSAPESPAHHAEQHGFFCHFWTNLSQGSFSLHQVGDVSDEGFSCLFPVLSEQRKNGLPCSLHPCPGVEAGNAVFCVSEKGQNCHVISICVLMMISVSNKRGINVSEFVMKNQLFISRC